MTLYVEGGGDAPAFKTACRKGFRDFLRRAGIRSEPKIVACGPRRRACERFCFALAAGDTAYLLLDSEEGVAAACRSGQLHR